MAVTRAQTNAGRRELFQQSLKPAPRPRSRKCSQTKESKGPATVAMTEQSASANNEHGIPSNGSLLPFSESENCAIVRIWLAPSKWELGLKKSNKKANIELVLSLNDVHVFLEAHKSKAHPDTIPPPQLLGKRKGREEDDLPSSPKRVRQANTSPPSPENNQAAGSPHQGAVASPERNIIDSSREDENLPETSQSSPIEAVNSPGSPMEGVEESETVYLSNESSVPSAPQVQSSPSETATASRKAFRRITRKKSVPYYGPQLDTIVEVSPDPAQPSKSVGKDVEQRESSPKTIPKPADTTSGFSNLFLDESSSEDENIDSGVDESPSLSRTAKQALCAALKPSQGNPIVLSPDNPHET